MIIGQSNITEAERAKRRNFIEESLATLALEGLKPCDETIALGDRYVSGELTVMELSVEIQAMSESKFGPLPLRRD